MNIFVNDGIVKYCALVIHIRTIINAYKQTICIYIHMLEYGSVHVRVKMFMCVAKRKGDHKIKRLDTKSDKMKPAL